MFFVCLFVALSTFFSYWSCWVSFFYVFCCAQIFFFSRFDFIFKISVVIYVLSGFLSFSPHIYLCVCVCAVCVWMDTCGLCRRWIERERARERKTSYAKMLSSYLWWAAKTPPIICVCDGKSFEAYDTKWKTCTQRKEELNKQTSGSSSNSDTSEKKKSITTRKERVKKRSAENTGVKNLDHQRTNDEIKELDHKAHGAQMRWRENEKRTECETV